MLRRLLTPCRIPIGPKGYWKHRQAPGPSLKQACRTFNEIGGKTIVEVGTGIHGKLSGNSMQEWVKRTEARHIIAVDMDPARLQEVADAVGDSPRVELVEADGIAYLEGFNGTVDLLYLDFWVVDEPGALQGTARSEAYRQVYEAAREKLPRKALVLIDDTDHIHPWKHTQLVPLARQDGFQVVYEGRQTLLRRG